MAASAVAALLLLRRAASSAAAAAASPGTAKTRRKKNLVEVAQFLPNWGLGAKLTKGHWQRGTFYELTRIELGKDARHGSAWGVFHDSGVPKTGVEQKIGGVNKRIWKYIKEDEKEKFWKKLRG